MKMSPLLSSMIAVKKQGKLLVGDTGRANLPVCGKCGQVVTPADSRIHPEYFRHDTCLPEALKSTETAELPSSANPYQWVIDWMRGERWSQRQDSTLSQVNDILPLVYALGCYDAGECIQRFFIQQK